MRFAPATIRSGARGAALPAGLAAALLLTACTGGNVLPQSPPPAQSHPVQSQAVEPAWFQARLETVSTLEADAEVELAAQAGGRIQRLLVRQGDRVAQGQVLLVLDQAQLRAEVARLRALMQTNRLNYDRYRELARQGAASAIQRDEFRQAYIAAREALVARQADLAFKDLRAPIAGTVADLRLKQGDVIAPGVPITRLIRNNPLMARIDVPVGAASRVRPGQRVVVLDPSRVQPLAEGLVRSVDPGVTRPSQTLLVQAAVANPQGRLRHGQRVRTQVLLDPREQLAVPAEAVSVLAGQAFVFVVGTFADLERQPGQAPLAALRRLPAGTLFALQTPVQLGNRQGQLYPLVRGLRRGDRLITAGLPNLRHAAPVRLMAASDAGPS